MKVENYSSASSSTIVNVLNALWEKKSQQHYGKVLVYISFYDVILDSAASEGPTFPSCVCSILWSDAQGKGNDIALYIYAWCKFYTGGINILNACVKSGKKLVSYYICFVLL